LGWTKELAQYWERLAKKMFQQEIEVLSSGSEDASSLSGKTRIDLQFNYLPIESNIPLDGECCSFLCEQIIHHVLFMRQQIPW